MSKRKELIISKKLQNKVVEMLTKAQENGAMKSWTAEEFIEDAIDNACKRMSPYQDPKWKEFRYSH